MPTRLVHLVLDANDKHSLADFWAAALGWEKDDDEEEPAIAPAGYDYPDPAALAICFCPVPEPKTAKNRVHLDLITKSAEHYQETIDRLLALGATRTDIGQRDVRWEVLADLEGNEFCVLTPR
jgi:predicted enzyme related to lactoylglutathione lyase